MRRRPKLTNVLAWGASAAASALARHAPAMPEDEGVRALAAGDLERAERAAQALLARAARKDDEWLPGDLRHRGHTLLGFVHLHRGELDLAVQALLRSAEIKPTPVLSSFGPDLGLAWALLLEGRGDAVCEFAERVARFWECHPAEGRLARSG